MENNKNYRECLNKLKSNKAKQIVMSALSLVMAVVLMGAHLNPEEPYTAEFVSGRIENDTNAADESDTLLANTLSTKGSGVASNMSVERVFTINVNVDGEIHSASILSTTVAQVLKKLDITLGEDDIVSPDFGETVSKGDEITVTRVTYGEEITTEAIPFDTEYRESSLIKDGKTYTIVNGVNGSKDMHYDVKYHDGVAATKRVISENITSAPISAVVLVGASGVPVSDLDFDVKLDENGIPTEYAYVLTEQVATAYNAGKRAWGASGMELFYGYVATRADEIPYGTKMYITSADNSFVYGFAIAADTGTGLMDYIIDVDLYYETYIESCLNGRHSVNIYILD